MKYSAKQLKAGNWAVFIGKQYFTDSVTPDKTVAVIHALKKSARWHQSQMDIIHRKLTKIPNAIDREDAASYLA